MPATDLRIRNRLYQGLTDNDCWKTDYHSWIAAWSPDQWPLIRINNANELLAGTRAGIAWAVVTANIRMIGSGEDNGDAVVTAQILISI